MSEKELINDPDSPICHIGSWVDEQDGHYRVIPNRCDHTGIFHHSPKSSWELTNQKTIECPRGSTTETVSIYVVCLKD